MGVTDYTEIELIVHDTSVEVWRRAKQVVSFAVNGAGGLCFMLRDTADMEWVQHLPLDRKNLDVYLVRYHKEGIMALPRTVKEPVQTTVVKARRKTAGPGPDTVNVDHIPESKRDQVLGAILDSMIDQPDQTRSQIADIGIAIAERYGERKMAVAGVRANLTRGAYGDIKILISNRIKSRRAAASAALAKPTRTTTAKTRR